MQVKAGVRKEWTFFSRGFRMVGLTMVFLGCAAFMPLLFGLMGSMGDTLDKAAEEAGGIENIEGMEVFGDDFDMDALFKLYEGENGMRMSYIGSMEMLCSTAAGNVPLAGMAMLILLGGTAGGEQKKRSIIMPQTAGLSPSGYVLPKFILYPPIMFIMSVVSVILCYGVCYLVFKITYPFEAVIATACITGVSVVFMLCMFLFLGIALGAPGLSVIYVLIGQMIFAGIVVSGFEIERFTPWNLNGMSTQIIYNASNSKNIFAGIGIGNIAATVAITLILCVVFMLLTLFAVKAKKMDNTADEVY